MGPGLVKRPSVYVRFKNTVDFLLLSLVDQDMLIAD